jgi:hypothetical protein
MMQQNLHKPADSDYYMSGTHEAVKFWGLISSVC